MSVAAVGCAGAPTGAGNHRRSRNLGSTSGWGWPDGAAAGGDGRTRLASGFGFSVIEPAMDSYLFLRCLRNSVAHALFSITESNREVCYEFHTEQKPLLKRAVIGHSELIRFLSIVGQRFSNQVLGQKPEAPA